MQFHCKSLDFREPIWVDSRSALFVFGKKTKSRCKTGPLSYRGWHHDNHYRTKLHTIQGHATKRFGKIDFVGCGEA